MPLRKKTGDSLVLIFEVLAKSTSFPLTEKKVSRGTEVKKQYGEPTCLNNVIVTEEKVIKGHNETGKSR